MKYYILFITFLTIKVFSASPIFFNDADLKCFDGELEIAFNWDCGEETSQAKLVFVPRTSENNFIRFRVGNDGYQLNNMFSITDGFGNDTFQVFAISDQDNGYPRYEIVAESHYDHEVGFLVGFYRKPIFDNGISIKRFSETITYLKPYTMECLNHTYP